jgi:ferredoxin-NADP reductase
LPERLLFLSGGSGITPVMSMLRTLLSRDHGRQIVFVHHARSKDDVIFAEELARIEREAPAGVRVHVRTGPFEAAALADLLPDFEEVDTWACGPEPFLAAVIGAFEARGAAGRVRTERFSVADTGGDGGEVVFARSERRGRGDGSLHAKAERAGLSPESGCRMGICRTCTCRKLSGVTRDIRTGEISTESGVDIQLCVSAPVGAVTLDL